MNVANLHSCIVHIGIHKTGSTSIQNFLQKHRKNLAGRGIHFYRGRHIDDNHVELHASCMRHGRYSTFKISSGLVFDEAYVSETRRIVSTFLHGVAGQTSLFSAEGLSLLCHADEVERLAEMLPREVSIIAYLRNPADYLRSHAMQIRRAGIPESDDRTSFPYFGADTWLIDYEFRLAAFRSIFGERNVHVIDYDEVCARDRSVIPSFMRCLGIEPDFADQAQMQMRLNQTPAEEA